jgi:hypothetical protein
MIRPRLSAARPRKGIADMTDIVEESMPDQAAMPTARDERRVR